jgi:sensor histidine kinase YesM
MEIVNAAYFGYSFDLSNKFVDLLISWSCFHKDMQTLLADWSYCCEDNSTENESANRVTNNVVLATAVDDRGSNQHPDSQHHVSKCMKESCIQINVSFVTVRVVMITSVILIVVVLSSLVVVVSVSVIMVVSSTNTSSWVIMDISLMQYFDLDQVKH